jgi:hypothetical protein
MPIEILEKIMSFVIPSVVSIPPTCTYPGRTTFLYQAFKWNPQWNYGLLAVSKSLRQVARRYLAQRDDAQPLIVMHWYVLIVSEEMSAYTIRRSGAYLLHQVLFTRDEVTQVIRVTFL